MTGEAARTRIDAQHNSGAKHLDPLLPGRRRTWRILTSLPEKISVEENQTPPGVRQQSRWVKHTESSKNSNLES